MGTRRTSLTGLILFTSLGVAGAAGSFSCKGDHDTSMELSQDDCVVCHQVEYDMTTAPPHADLFDTQCAMCHSNTAWVPAVPVAHDWYVLRFRHLEIPCTDCHTVGFRPGETPNTCIGCHQMAYDTAMMPPHNGYPTDCLQCHNEAAWRPSTFVHSWPLDGAHVATPCQDCHMGTPPVYVGTPRECVGCHRDNYDMTSMPSHATSGYPTTCVDCHSTTAWRPALEGGHPEANFPISRGAHEGFECLDCHDPALGSSADGMNTDCVGCHTGEHSRARMDDKHREEGDYPFGTTSVNFCLDCHPSGRTD